MDDDGITVDGLNETVDFELNTRSVVGAKKDAGRRGAGDQAERAGLRISGIAVAYPPLAGRIPSTQHGECGSKFADPTCSKTSIGRNPLNRCIAKRFVAAVRRWCSFLKQRHRLGCPSHEGSNE